MGSLSGFKAAAAALLFASATAHAGGKVSTPPPPPPAVDFGGLPETASVQPKNPDGKDHPVHARLLADSETVKPGDTVRVAVHLEQKTNWHTYWKSPGDIGLPTEIEWKNGAGATVTSHTYPVPQRFEQDDLVSYGYDDQVLLISELHGSRRRKTGRHRAHRERQLAGL